MEQKEGMVAVSSLYSCGDGREDGGSGGGHTEEGRRARHDVAGGGRGPGPDRRPAAAQLRRSWVAARTGDVGEADQWAPPHCRVVNQFKPSKSIQTRSNLIQIISNLIHYRKGLPKLGKIEIKYGFEEFEERNNFVHRNFFKLQVDFE
jgi:hypothetical protein